jgi:Rieske Fe-S protein
MNAPPDHRVENVDARGRRGFLTALGGLSLVWLGTLIYPIYRYLSPSAATNNPARSGKIKVDKISLADVAQPGQGKNGGYAGRGLIVLRSAEGQLRAFDAKCTHAGCNVAFEGARIACPCHGGVYDLSGKNVSGPPPKPLTELQVIEENGELFVSQATQFARS